MGNKYASQEKYDAKNTRKFGMKLNCKTDAEAIDKLDSVESIQGYVKQLIKTDVALSPLLRALCRKDVEGFKLKEIRDDGTCKVVVMEKDSEAIDVKEQSDGSVVIEAAGRVIEIYG